MLEVQRRMQLDEFLGQETSGIVCGRLVARSVVSDDHIGVPPSIIVVDVAGS